MTGSSPETEIQELETVLDTTDANFTDASSSSGTEGAKPSLIDSVRAVIGDKEQSPGSERDPIDPAVSPVTAAKPETELGDLTEAELKSYGPKTQRRINALLADRHDLTTKLSTFEGQAKQFEPVAQRAQQFRLTTEEQLISFELGGLLKTNPEAAKARLAPIMAKLEELTGNVLPPDLQERVALGYISEQDAKELNVTRTRLARNEGQTAAEREDRAAEDEQRTRTAHVNDARDVGNNWETAKKASDPDWPLKQERVAELIKLEVYEKGFPKAKADVQRMLDGIYDKVSKEVSRFAPRPKSVRAVTANASSRATAEPKTALEAARLALAR